MPGRLADIKYTRQILGFRDILTLIFCACVKVGARGLHFKRCDIACMRVCMHVGVDIMAGLATKETD